VNGYQDSQKDRRSDNSHYVNQKKIMKITVTTTYEPIDQEWLEWYISQLKKGKVPIDFDAMKKGFPVSFTSKDPTSQTKAITIYTLTKN
jgi:hypothetical protein